MGPTNRPPIIAREGLLSAAGAAAATNLQARFVRHPRSLACDHFVTTNYDPWLKDALARLFDLLKRAYIEARYSKSYHITLDELAALRRHVLDLAERVRRACANKLAAISEDGDIGELPELPASNDQIELPQLPALDDPHAVEAWREAIAQMSQERGEQRFREGEERGRREGEERVRQERTRAILDVLQRRWIALTDAQVERNYNVSRRSCACFMARTSLDCEHR